MGKKIKILEPAKVYDINNLKANPISELPAGAEIVVEDILKAWKSWYKLSLPDGRVGVISGITKIQYLGYIAPKAGGWSNFVKVLVSANPEQYGYDVMDCIKEYEQEIVNHIQADKDPAHVILGCNRAGADWLLQEEVIKNDVIDLLMNKALKLDPSSIMHLSKSNVSKKGNV